MIVPSVTGIIAGCNILDNMNYEDEEQNKKKGNNGKKREIKPDSITVTMADGKSYVGRTKKELKENIKEGRYLIFPKKKKSIWPF